MNISGLMKANYSLKMGMIKMKIWSLKIVSIDVYSMRNLP